MALALSIVALLATFYQLYLQRVHNEKSVKPLIQIDLTDQNGLLYVHMQNNGLGPVILEKLVFTKDGKIYTDITQCVELNPKEYQRVTISGSVKVVPPGEYLEVFSKQFGEDISVSVIDDVRHQLADLKLTVIGRDIYDHKITTERDLSWFARHLPKESHNMV
ncbi:hypothetical protein CKK33_06565 [Mucilaginibacter sp. MD40]|uniref:hypothetical protein n=1 Tax=Mucilaginibacter sp. MD40 TaxID=2029590 RepID=UPI000BACE617|nr:hypothetical protein [Mucilaginibacter sp. MD40]PAW93174.1 hypothetical protein CKK33_06565 [Mucilaginibacter sp. MD40]